MLDTIRHYFNAFPDKENELETIRQIEEGVSFRGANLWVLIFAILIASLGLNVNSTAVIIGAMLISPLMGPILGMGLSIGILDYALLKRSARNYAVATIISILTATIYFLLTPLTEAQSELLARTAPTLYDVFIALCGGAAGILALSTRAKSNVIPGVAIATALMPPLCTAGYGLATAQWIYFAGAFYLFFINTVFIALATFIGVRALHFQHRQFINTQRRRAVQRYIWTIVVLTMVPAALMTFSIVNNSVRESNIRRFVQEELKQEGTEVLSSQLEQSDSTLQVVAIGREIAQAKQTEAKKRMPFYGLKNYNLVVIQGTSGDSLLQLAQAGLHSSADKERLLSQVAQKQALEKQLHVYQGMEQLTTEVSREMGTLFPMVSHLSVAHMLNAATDTSGAKAQVMAIVTLRQDQSLSDNDHKRILQWLRQRCRQDSLSMIVRK